MYFSTWQTNFLCVFILIFFRIVATQVASQQAPTPAVSHEAPRTVVSQEPPKPVISQEVPKIVVSQEVPKPWYESLPAVAMDYKVHIDAGKEDCYNQYVQPGATFYVSFSVVRGGDGMAGFAVRNPAGQIVKPYQWQATADYTDQVSPGGYYSVCIDNQFSRFAGKLVNIYITVVKYDAWDQYAKEVEELQLNMENFKTTIGTVERNINDMLAYQYHSRNREARDYALVIDNNSYVQTFSVCQILVIILTCSVQVFFVRKLFSVRESPRSRI